MQLTDCTIEGNHGYGAVDNEYGVLTMTGCTITGNSSSYYDYAGGVTSKSSTKSFTLATATSRR